MSELAEALSRSRWLRLAAAAGLIAILVAIVATVFAIRYEDSQNASNSTASVLSRIGDAAAPTPGYVSVDRPASAIHLPSISGHGTVSSTKGRLPLLVNFWSSTCAPCRHEMPVLAAAARQLHRRVEILGVDTTDVAASGRAFAAAHGATYPDGSDPNETVGNRYGLAALPTTYFLSANRERVVGIYFGAMTAAQLDTALRRAYGIAA